MMFAEFGFAELEGHAWQLIFVMVRIGAALLAAPIFGAMSVPIQLRIVMTAGLAIFVLNWTAVETPVEMLSVTTFVSLAGEAVVGLTLGFVLQLSFAAPLIAAEQIAGGMGMAIATAVDPNSGSQSGAIGQFFTIMLTLAFLGCGGHLLWLRLVIESFSAMPPGLAWIDDERAWLVASFASQALATAAAIALPVTLVLLLVQMTTGVISRSAPSLNLFALGLPAGVLAGLAALIAVFSLLSDHFVALSLAAVEQAAQVLER